jgi:hypothetical protein
MRRSALLFPLSVGLVALVAALGCGSSEEESSQPAPAVDTSAQTAYGTVEEVSAYLETINPHIRRVGELQQTYETALASAREGAMDRRGTGRNLAMKAAEVRPEFKLVMDQLDAIEPPPLLAPFHRDIRKMLTTRMESFARTMEGWEVEQAEGDFEPIYRDAEAKYEAANQQILQLNTQMNRINQSIEGTLAAGG